MEPCGIEGAPGSLVIQAVLLVTRYRPKGGCTGRIVNLDLPRGQANCLRETERSIGRYIHAEAETFDHDFNVAVEFESFGACGGCVGGDNEWRGDWVTPHRGVLLVGNHGDCAWDVLDEGLCLRVGYVERNSELSSAVRKGCTIAESLDLSTCRSKE